MTILTAPIVSNLFNQLTDIQTELLKKNVTVSAIFVIFFSTIFWFSACCFLNAAVTNAQQVVEQPDPCKSKSRLVGDVEYCDRYWECEDREPVLYDCPNGLVWVGKDRGIADGCDYPWRNPTLCRNKDLASK